MCCRPTSSSFLKRYPSVNVHVEYRRDDQVYENVLGNVVDLGLVAYPTRDARLEIVPLRTDTLVLICHPQHPLAKRKSVRVKALNGQKFINFEKDIPTRKALDKIFKDHRVTVEQVMQFDNIETVKRAVEIDSGLAIVPQETDRLRKLPTRPSPPWNSRTAPTPVRWESSTRRTRCYRRPSSSSSHS